MAKLAKKMWTSRVFRATLIGTFLIITMTGIYPKACNKFIFFTLLQASENEIYKNVIKSREIIFGHRVLHSYLIYYILDAYNMNVMKLLRRAVVARVVTPG